MRRALRRWLSIGSLTPWLVACPESTPPPKEPAATPEETPGSEPPIPAPTEDAPSDLLAPPAADAPR